MAGFRRFGAVSAREISAFIHSGSSFKDLASGFPDEFVGEGPDQRKCGSMGQRNNEFFALGGERDENPGRKHEEENECVEKHERIHGALLFIIRKLVGVSNDNSLFHRMKLIARRCAIFEICHSFF